MITGKFLKGERYEVLEDCNPYKKGDIAEIANDTELSALAAHSGLVYCYRVLEDGQVDTKQSSIYIYKLKFDSACNVAFEGEAELKARLRLANTLLLADRVNPGKIKSLQEAGLI